MKADRVVYIFIGYRIMLGVECGYPDKEQSEAVDGQKEIKFGEKKIGRILGKNERERNFASAHYCCNFEEIELRDALSHNRFFKIT